MCLFHRKTKTTAELQAELRALCDTVAAKQYIAPYDIGRYENILKELYLRGEKPETLIQSSTIKK